MYLHPVSSQLLSPFFSLLGNFACLVKKSLAGDEVNEWSDSQLSLLRQDIAWGVLEQDQVFNPQNDQVPRVRQSEAVERWEKKNAFGKNAALFMSRLWPSFLVTASCCFSLDFLFSKSKRGGNVLKVCRDDSKLTYMASKDGKRLKDVIVPRLSELQRLDALKSEALEQKEKVIDFDNNRVEG
jgi:hypothetical protein